MRSGSRTRRVLLWLSTILPAISGAVHNGAFLSAQIPTRSWSRDWSQGVNARIVTLKGTSKSVGNTAPEDVWVKVRIPTEQTDGNKASAVDSTAYRLNFFRAGPNDLPILLVQLHDSRQFAFVDWCPPTGHTLCNSVVDADVLSIEDVVFGTRFDLRTGNVRGQWCPGLKGIASALPSKPLKALQLRIGEDGVTEVRVPNEESKD